MEKNILRRKYASRRCILTGKARTNASKKIASHFIKNVFPLLTGCRGAACYHSTKTETPSGGIISFLHKNKIPVFLPAVTGPGEMEFRLFEKASALRKGAYGIYEPAAKNKKARVKDIQIIIVPGAAFDRSGTRLGMGGGYYDRFLAKLPENVIKAGLAYSCRIARTLPSDSHDIKMDLIITEKGVINARKKTLRKTNLQRKNSKLKG